MLQRSAGILIPLFSLRTADDLGRGEIMQMKAMIDFAISLGHRTIQLLPLDETAPSEASPYAALTLFAIDPLYISAAELAGVGKLAMNIWYAVLTALATADAITGVSAVIRFAVMFEGAMIP